MMNIYEPSTHWVANRALLATGAVIYTLLVVSMIYTIVNLIRVGEWQVRAPARHLASHELRAIDVSEAAAYPRIQSADLRTCNPEIRLDSGKDSVSQRDTRECHTERIANGNLVWAPPGTNIVSD